MAYVFGSSRCGSCRRPETKVAIGALRNALRANTKNGYASVRVVGVAINTDVSLGLEYLQNFGRDTFDEVSAGDGWQNEHVVRLIWQGGFAQPEAPQVVLVSRDMDASLAPVALRFSKDSVIAVIAGYNAILDWVHAGAPLGDVTKTSLSGDGSESLSSSSLASARR